MKEIVRLFGLAMVLVLALASSSFAYGLIGCYASCPDGNIYFVQVNQCCGYIPRYEYTCPDGSDAYGIGYEGWGGPQFCV